MAALHLAAYSGKLECMRYLVENDADVNLRDVVTRYF